MTGVEGCFRPLPHLITCNVRTSARFCMGLFYRGRRFLAAEAAVMFLLQSEVPYDRLWFLCNPITTSSHVKGYHSDGQEKNLLLSSLWGLAFGCQIDFSSRLCIVEKKIWIPFPYAARTSDCKYYYVRGQSSIANLLWGRGTLKMICWVILRNLSAQLC